MQITHSESFTILPEESGERLDKVLALRYTDQSRTYFQSLIDNAYVAVNDRSVKKRHSCVTGEEVTVQFALTAEISLDPENIPLDILFEDDEILVVNKPAGLVVHPGPGNWSGTFVNALLFHCQALERGETLRPGIVHRLDKDTSGVLVAAKTLYAHQRLIEGFAGRQVYKEYLAICLGNPGETWMEAPIGRHPVKRKEMCVREDGKAARTHVETLAYNGKLAAVRLILETGRTHQIRVHLKYRGCPILGDAVYGNSSSNSHYAVSRQLLHAYRLKLQHPKTGEALEFCAPVPADFQHYLSILQCAC